MIKTITKDKCIEAVMTEPLRAGTWNYENNKTCEVCAVGAIFRQIEVHGNLQISDKMFRGRTYYMDHLSDYFEYTLPETRNKITQRKRDALALFIEAFFPDVLEIEI